MIRILLIFSSIIISAANICMAQAQIPNSGFEDWGITDTIPPINPAEPIGWTTSNFLMNAGGNQTVFQTEDAVEGNFAVKIVSDTSVVSPPFGTGVLDTLSGFLALGVVNQISLGGITYTDRPDSMSIWIKGIVIPGDTSSILVTLVYYDDFLQTTDTIGILMPIIMTVSDTVYKKVTVPFLYSSNENPNLLLVRMGVGGRRGGEVFPGNELFIDDIQFIGLSTATKQVHAPEQTVKVSPNPMSQQSILEFGNPNNNSFDFTLMNTNGEVLKKTQNINSSQFTLQRENLPAGLYYYTFSTKGQIVYSGKLVIL